VAEDVKRRPYASVLRTQQAAATRTAVLASARRLFTTKGYAATSVSEVAADAGVSLDTVYASVGRKPRLLLAVIDMILGSSEQPISAEDRDYVKAVRAAPTARQKIATYTQALGRFMPRVAPLFGALREAAVTDPECTRLSQELASRRAVNMALFATELRATGELRGDLSDDQVADLIWTTNAPEFFELVAARGRTPGEYADLLADLWTRTLLAS
jgi:AcrR family transcriptional regulator